MDPDQVTRKNGVAATIININGNPKDPFSKIREKVLMIPSLQQEVKDQANEILQLRQELQLKSDEAVKTNDELDAKNQEVLTLKDEIKNLKRILDNTEKQKRTFAVYLKKATESETLLRQEVEAASVLQYENINLTEEVSKLRGVVRKLKVELVETNRQKRKVEKELDRVKAEISDLALVGGEDADMSEADESDEHNHEGEEPVMPVLAPMKVGGNQGKEEERGVGAKRKRPRKGFWVGAKRNEKNYDADQSLLFTITDESERLAKVLLNRCGIPMNYITSKK